MRKMGSGMLALMLAGVVSCSSETASTENAAAANGPAQLIVGKWRFSDAEDQSMEFSAEGRLSMSGASGQARYQLEDNGILVIKPLDSDEEQRFKVIVSENELTLTEAEESEPAQKTDQPPETVKLIRAK